MNSITLKDFISASLVSIVEGVRDAQSKTGGSGGSGRSGIGATFFLTKQEQDKTGPPTAAGTKTIVEKQGVLSDPTQRIEFDIAVTVENRGGIEAQAEGSLGGAIKVFGLAEIDAMKFAGELKGKSEESHSLVSRVKFSVPIVFDMQAIHLLLEKQTFNT